MNRTAAANPRRVFVYLCLWITVLCLGRVEGGGRGGVGWGLGEGKKKVTDQRVQGLVKKKEFQPEQCFLCHAEQKAKRFVYLRAAEEERGRRAKREAFARL